MVSGGWFRSRALPSAREDHGVHAHAGERSAIYVDGIHLAGSHHAAGLFHDALDGDAFGRINFDGDDEFFGLDFFPEFAIGLASGHPAKSFGRLEYFDGAGLDWFCSARFIEMNFLNRFGNGVDVFRSSSAAAADQARAQFGSFLGEEREIFGRGAWVHDAVADAFGKTCVGHDAERQGGAGREFAQHGKQKLRADGAVRADGLNIFIFQFFPGVLRTSAAEGGAFVGVGHLRDDGQAREGTNRVNGGEQFFHVAESFQHEEVHAALFECSGLLLEDGENFFGGKFANVLDDSERADGASNQDFVLGGFARFAGNFYSAMIQFGDAVCHAEEAELVAVGAESIGLDDLGAGFEVALVDVEDGVGCERVELVHAALRADGFVKQRAHGAVNDQDGVAKAFVEGFNLHRDDRWIRILHGRKPSSISSRGKCSDSCEGKWLWPRVEFFLSFVFR